MYYISPCNHFSSVMWHVDLVVVLDYHQFVLDYHRFVLDYHRPLQLWHVFISFGCNCLLLPLSVVRYNFHLENISMIPQGETIVLPTCFEFFWIHNPFEFMIIFNVVKVNMFSPYNRLHLIHHLSCHMVHPSQKLLYTFYHRCFCHYCGCCCHHYLGLCSQHYTTILQYWLHHRNF